MKEKIFIIFILFISTIFAVLSQERNNSNYIDDIGTLNGKYISINIKDKEEFGFMLEN